MNFILSRIRTRLYSLKFLFPFYGYKALLNKKNKIFIYGSYGVGNIGDEVILESILLQLSKIKNYQFIVISKNPYRIYKNYGVLSINPNFIKFLMPIINSKTKKGILLVGGGGLLKDYGNSPKSLRKFFAPINIFLNNNYRTMLYSAGAENIIYKESKKLIKSTLNKFDVLTVRDNNSKSLLKSVGVKKNIFVTGDPAILKYSDINFPKQLPKNKLIILVSVRHWYEKGFFSSNEEVFNKFLLTFSKFLNHVISKYNAKIIFAPFRTEFIDDDRIIIKKIIAKLNSSDNSIIFNNYSNNKNIDRYYKLADIVIGMRLHSIILSFSSIIPMIALSYSSKVKDFMNEIGFSNYCHGISEITAEILLKDIENILNNYSVLRSTLKSKHTSYLNKINSNISLLNKLL